ncbi:hypothetical protein B0H11DRAFT_1925749 [Mycena galericulata]|nr:hypothetical protein B0H11DRAFT_1925749 [Mycena galericulata]
MSTNANSTNANALKRMRQNTAGGSIPTSTFYSDGASASATFVPNNTVSTEQYGAVWKSIYDTLIAGQHAVPSPNMVKAFAEIHLKSLNDYKGAQASLQRATTTCSGFTQSAAGGAPSVITNHLKMPPYQLVKLAPSVDEDPRVVEALKVANNSLKAVHDATTTLLSTVYAVQVEHYRFEADLTAYCQSCIQGAGYEADNRFETCITMLKSAFTRELEEHAIDFTAKLIKSNAQKEAKAVTLANARADAEMADATKPVMSMIGEEIKNLLGSQGAFFLSSSHPFHPSPSADTLVLDASPGVHRGRT